ncbi:MAG TPA: Uma2 family endonuclease [Isosphaeraceae bacterium]|jgi:Uma2 family endonuclease|nr:Uma2 family endonuclease [Isosphaeraceae bacterium]
MGDIGQVRATIEDLYKVDGKAELIDGRIVPQMATGFRPSEIAANIYVSLRHQARGAGAKAFTDNLGFVVPELDSGRESFSPDAAYYTGPPPADPMRFIEGPPDFAVEVRSEGEYGPAAEAELAAKRADYFEAGTKVVWDVDPLAEAVHSYRAEAPDRPTTFRRGAIADAEPAVPGWRIAVDEVFE